MPHEVPGQVHWHEPAGGQQGRLRQVRQARDALRQVHGDRRDSGPSRHRRQQGAESAAPAVAADGRTRHLHPALRHRGQMGLLRRRGAGARRAQCREASLRGDLLRRRGPRLDRGVARGRQQAPYLRMAAGLALLDSLERDASRRQRDLGAGAAAGRHDRAQRHEPHQQHRRDLRVPIPVPRPVQRRRRFLQAQ